MGLFGFVFKPGAHVAQAGFKFSVAEDVLLTLAPPPKC